MSLPIGRQTCQPGSDELKVKSEVVNSEDVGYCSGIVLKPVEISEGFEFQMMSQENKWVI